MIEIGSSAGFNLLWNRYHYRYTSTLPTDELTRGESTSPVHLHCALDGAALPPLPEHFPRVALCQGIELLPRELSNEADMRWIRAAIWPEKRVRHHLLDAVIRFAQQTPFLLHRGDACDSLPALLADILEQHTAVVWHSYAVHQGPLQVQERIEQQVAAASHKQTIYRISLEFIEQAGPMLELLTYAKGKLVKREHLANCAVHGERMTWLLPS